MDFYDHYYGAKSPTSSSFTPFIYSTPPLKDIDPDMLHNKITIALYSREASSRYSDVSIRRDAATEDVEEDVEGLDDSSDESSSGACLIAIEWLTRFLTAAAMEDVDSLNNSREGEHSSGFEVLPTSKCSITSNAQATSVRET